MFAKVTGFQPHTIRVDLERCEVPVLAHELLHRISTKAESLLESSAPDDEALSVASNWLLEYSKLLGQLSDDDQPADGPVPVMIAMVMAPELIRSCCQDAADRLRDVLSQKAAPDLITEASCAAHAWAETYAGLRYLDTNGLENIAL